MTAPTSPDVYSPLIDSEFTVHLDGGITVGCTLTAVKSNIDDDIQSCFALYFLGPEPSLPQLLHRVSHPKLGEFPLFLVPIQKKRDGFVYEAVFNLLKDEAQ